MNNGFQFFDIILFGAIAAFFIYKLRGAIGRKMGHDRPPFEGFPGSKSDKKDEGDDKVVHLPGRGAKGEEEGDVDLAAGPERGRERGPAIDEDEDQVAAGLARIALADKGFDDKSFLTGARAAFEMIVKAFAEGDSKALRPLLSNDVYRDFSGAIESRRRSGDHLETTLVGIEEAEIIEAELESRTAFITIKFISEQINVLRDRNNKVLEGDATHVAKITDIWTFARNTRSRDPNWTLVATRSPN